METDRWREQACTRTQKGDRALCVDVFGDLALSVMGLYLHSHNRTAKNRILRYICAQWSQRLDLTDAVGHNQGTKPGGYVCVFVYVCFDSEYNRNREKGMPSITKAERPWQSLGVLIILPTVCGRAVAHTGW